MTEYIPKWAHLSASVTPASVTHTHECKVCGNGFTAHRSDAKYCGPNCRKTYSRKRQGMKREKRRAIDAIRELRILAGDDPKLLDLASRLEDEIAVTLAGVTDK